MAQKKRLKGKKSRKPGRVMYYDTDLHALLVERLPQFAQDGKLRVAKLAEAMGYSAFAVYRTLTENRLSPRSINCLLEIAAQEAGPEEARLTKDDLLKFLLN